MILEQYFVKAQKKLPEIDLNAISGDLSIRGKSIPENATLTYKPIAEWISDYVKQPAEETNLHLNLEYFNTATSIWIAKIIKLLSFIDNHGKLLIIHLYFDLEDYDEMQTEDINEAISPIVDVLSEATVSIGVKIYGKDDSNSVVKEKLILL